MLLDASPTHPVFLLYLWSAGLKCAVKKSERINPKMTRDDVLVEARQQRGHLPKLPYAEQRRVVARQTCRLAVLSQVTTVNGNLSRRETREVSLRGCRYVAVVRKQTWSDANSAEFIFYEGFCWTKFNFYAEVRGYSWLPMGDHG